MFVFCLFVWLRVSQRRKKDSGVKLCMRVQLLSGHVLSHFGELWLAWSHGGGITSGMYGSTYWCQGAAPGEARWAFGNGGGPLPKAVWWDLRLALSSLPTHLLSHHTVVWRNT